MDGFGECFRGNVMPDLSTLPKRIRYAAGVLIEVRDHALDLHRNDDFDTRYSWDVGSSLLKCADVWEQHADRLKIESDARRKMIEQLADEMKSDYESMSLNIIIDDWWPNRARKLIDRGWRKGDVK